MEESEYQNSKFNNNGNNSYKIKPKTYKMKDLVGQMLTCGQKGWLKVVKGQVHAMAWLGDMLALFLL